MRFYDKQVDWNDVGADVKYFKLENLSENTTEIQLYLDLTNSKLPKVNSQEFTFDYMNLVTPEIKDIIIELFEEDFDELGYKK